MNKLFRCGALAAMLALAVTAPVSASELSLTINNGRVTLVAEDVTVRQILAEWARVGETQIVNGDKMPGGPITLELRDVPEMKALEILLRSAAGYVVAPRLSSRTGPSAYERVVILATSNPPPVTSVPPPAFSPQRSMTPMIPPNVDQTGDPEPPNQSEAPEMVPGATATQPGYVPVPGQQPQQPAPGPLTAPRPGPLPQPAGQPGNPFVPGQPPTPPTRPGGGGVVR